MKRDIADRWIAALESGEYMKGKRRLCGETSSGHTAFCCLGVLSELAIQDGVPVEKEWFDKEEFPFALYDNVREVLPERVRDWAGMKSRGGRFCNDAGGIWTLIDINDRTNGFGQVIEAIRNHAEEL